MSYSRSAFAAAIALCAAVSSPAVAHAADSATIKVSAAGKRALKPSSLTISASKLTVGSTTVGSSAKLALGGSLRFKSGKRTVSATGLSLSIGRTSSSVSARLGKKSIRLLTVTPTRPAQLSADAVTLANARFALTPAAAKALRTALRLKRTPSTKALGTLSVSYAKPADAPAPAPIPAPAPGATPAPTATPTPVTTPTPSATPVATATPGPNLACDQRYTATPANIVDWFGCGMAGSNDLKSWTSYVQRAFPQFPCQGPVGSIVAGFGASQVVAGDPLDHRFPVLSSTVRPDGSATIVVGGHVTYTMPVHGIDEQLGSLRIEIAAGGLTGTVFADGHAKPFDMSGGSCSAPPTPYANQPVLSLDLAGIAPVTADNVIRWVKVPATVIDTADRIGGGEYSGRPWGTFTIALPVR